MKLVKKLLTGVAIAAAMATAQASPITVGGVTWDPDNDIDFSAASVAIHQFINGTSGVVSGFGTINTINGSPSFCSGCELTFQFGGFSPTTGLLPSPAGGTILYTGGFVNVYVDSTPEAINLVSTTMTSASTGDGNLWLSLAGHQLGLTTTTFAGTVNTSVFGPSSLTGGGLLDVTGGLAAGNLNTNSQVDGADFAFSNSFTTFLSPGSLLDTLGTGNFNGTSVPEPTSLALLGLGLVGLAAARRRKQAK